MLCESAFKNCKFPCNPITVSYSLMRNIFVPRRVNMAMPMPSQRRTLRLTLLAVALASPAMGMALDFGPFSLTGFGKVEFQRGSNHCPDCQVFPAEDKQRQWADELVPQATFRTTETHVTLLQPYLGAKFDLGRGVKLQGLLSQRWRDGKVDIPGYVYERNVALSHEDYGSLRIGDMTTRSWSVADYPYGSNIGVSDAWASSGAGYGLVKNAVRYTSRLLDVGNGDLVLEATYGLGNTDFHIHKPRFWEFYAQYHQGDLVLDAMLQDTRNGNPQAWGHGPFGGPTASADDDRKVGGNGQSIAMLMGRYQVDSRIELSAGIRRNRWSGAYAVVTSTGTPQLWNNMFNVDWGGTMNGVANPGYAATSVDLMAGLRYRMGAWTASTGLAYLGKASTNNPSERGQSNSALVNTLGLNYDFGNGFQAYGLAGMVHYSRRGLSPMSMPSNSAFTNVDSRTTRTGNWFGAGMTYTF